MAHGMECYLPHGTNFRIVCFPLRNPPRPWYPRKPFPLYCCPVRSERARAKRVRKRPLDQENLPATDMRCLTVVHGAQQLCGDDPGTRTALARGHPVLREERSDLDHIESAAQAPGARRQAYARVRPAVAARRARPYRPDTRHASRQPFAYDHTGGSLHALTSGLARQIP